mgnify:CR=1 FL=1
MQKRITYPPIFVIRRKLCSMASSMYWLNVAVPNPASVFYRHPYVSTKSAANRLPTRGLASRSLMWLSDRRRFRRLPVSERSSPQTSSLFFSRFCQYMQMFEIMTDSTANLTGDMIRDYHLHVLSLSFVVDGKEYKGYEKGKTTFSRISTTYFTNSPSPSAADSESTAST